MSILIKNALVYDGGGKPGFKADVLVKGERIAGVGSFNQGAADQTIDAMGSMVTPGLIDINTDSDHYLSLFADPYQKDFIKQGVTTIIGGNCGSSLAPLIKGTLESIRKWADINQVNVNWHSLAEFFNVLKNQGLGVNFGSLIGHSTIRRGLVGESFRDLTDHEMASFKEILETAFREGAFGFSTGLGYVHSRFVPYSEVRSLVEIATRFKRVYATHLRNEADGVLAAINETISLAKDTGAKVEISHFRPLNGFKADYDKSLEMIKANAADTHINFDLYPFETSVVPIYTLLPEWAKQGGLDIMRENIAAKGVRERLLESFPNIKGDDIIIAKSNPGYEFLNGKTLKEFAENREIKSLKEALLELMNLTCLKSILIYKNVNFDAVLKFLSEDQAIISSNAAGLPDKSFKPERYYNTFPKFFQLVKEKNLMPIETAVFKASSLPARKYGIKERGLLVEGYFADLVVFRDEKPSEVIMNGQLVLENGEVKKLLAGKILTAS